MNSIAILAEGVEDVKGKGGERMVCSTPSGLKEKK
jgi:hypothetical protein